MRGTAGGGGEGELLTNKQMGVCRCKCVYMQIKTSLSLRVGGSPVGKVRKSRRGNYLPVIRDYTYHFNPGGDL